MPKKADLWFRASSNTWVVSTKGKLTTLAKGKECREEAVLRWREIQAGAAEAKAVGLTVGELTDRFMVWAEGRLAEATVIWYRRHLGSFTAFVGRPKGVVGLKPSDCLAWIDSTTWGPTTRHGAITAAKRLLAWGVLYAEVAGNPFAAMERPGVGRKTRIPTTAEVNELVEGARGGTRDFMAFLVESGCRQSEACRLTVGCVDLEAGVCVMHGKTTRATDRPRVIYLTEAAKAILIRRMAGLGRDGHVFVTRAGNPWTRKTTKDAVKLIRRRLGLGPHVTAGGLRHWWITERLRAGASIAMVAQLAGHTSTVMISRHYGHLEKCSVDLRRALERKAS